MSIKKWNKVEIILEETDGMLNELKKLVDENYYCITKLFCYGNLPYDLNHVAERKATTLSERFNSLCELQDYLSQIYVGTEVERLINNYYDNTPLYFEQDDILYINLELVSGAGMVRPWKDYGLTVLEQDENSCLFATKVSFEEDHMHVGEEEESYVFRAVYEKGWRLEKMVSTPIYE